MKAPNVKLSMPKFHAWVYYDSVNPNTTPKANDSLNENISTPNNRGTEGVSPHQSYEDVRKSLDYSRLRRVTMASFLMGILISMGGFVFGYDTGQISGFLEMPDFLRRFGQFDTRTDKYYFSNVRAGLIVSMVHHFARPKEP